MPRFSTSLAWLAGFAAAVVYFLPPPSGAAPVVMHAAALMLLTVSLWATGVIPEYITSLLFFLLAVVLAIASPQVVFSSFTSATMWLVLGGLILAEAVGATGLGRRFASVLFERFTGNYASLMIAVALVSTALAFFMPAKTPASIVAKFNADLNAMVKSGAIDVALKSAGATAVHFDQAQSQAYVEKEIATWAAVIKAAGLKAD